MTTTNAERVAKWRAENPERAKAQTNAAGHRYRERKRIEKMTEAEMMAELIETQGDTRT